MRALSTPGCRSRSRGYLRTPTPIKRIPIGDQRKVEMVWGFLMISPWLLRFLFLNLSAMVASLYFSFTDYQILSPPEWTGVANYASLIKDSLFWKSIYNTIFYTVFAVPGQLVVAFCLALLLNSGIKGTRVFRTICYLPAMIPPVANAVLWLWIFNSQVGLAGTIFKMLGLNSPPWLVSPSWSKPSLIFMSLWYCGRAMIIFLAGLQDIPKQLYEAAEIDGANWWNIFLFITVPLMTPTILFNLVMGLIDSFQVFIPAFVMTQGGPLNSTLFYVLYLYRNAFEYFRMGYASALAWVLFLIVVVFTTLIFKWSGRWVFYGSGS